MGEAARKLEGTLVGSYRVGRLLGAGAMGSVFLLEHARLPNTFAALKVLNIRRADSDLLRERFVQEAMVAAAIGGDRVARPLDIGRLDDGTPYIVMEYVAGRTLDALLEAGPLSVSAALTIAHSVAETMALAHERGIIHRDLKPSNLMLVGDDVHDVKVLDFGVARAVGEIKLAQTLESAVIGSPGYMSPEAASGMAVDDRTDVFSLAVTLFKLLTGILPFRGHNAQAILAALLTREPATASDCRLATLDPIPRAVDELLARALARQAVDRPSMAELRDQLRDRLVEVGPAPVTAPRKSSPASTPASPDVDELGATLRGTTDPEKVRQLAERFAAARIPLPTTAPVRQRRSWQVVALLVIGSALAIVAARGAWLGSRHQAPPRHLVTPAQRQITFSGDVTLAALSPDGKTVAYSAGGVVGLRDLDGEATRVIGDHQLGRSILWAPDSSAVYYVRLGKLKDVVSARRDAGKAEPVPLDDGLIALAPDGREVLTDDSTNGMLYFTDLLGKPLRPDVHVPGEFNFILQGDWARGGDRLLLETLADEQVQARILSIDGKRHSLLNLEGLVGVGYYDDRTLLWLRHEGAATTNQLMVQRLDAERLATDEEPRMVLPETRGAQFSVSRDGRLATFIDRGDGSTALWAVTIDEHDQPQARELALGTAITCGSGASEGGNRLAYTTGISPDGSRLAYSTLDGAGADLMVMSLDGSERRRVARLTGCKSLIWSPDGRSLAWRDQAKMIILSLDGGAPRELPLTKASGSDQSLAWPRADRVLYHTDNNREWRVVDVGTGAITPLTSETTGWSFYPVGTPDGSQIALWWNRDDYGTWLVGLDDGRPRRLTDERMTPQGWSADGKTLYTTPNERAAVEHNFRLFKIPINGGKAQPWVTLPFDKDASCTFARDGRHAICAVMRAHSDVWLIQNFGDLVAAAR